MFSKLRLRVFGVLVRSFFTLFAIGVVTIAVSLTNGYLAMLWAAEAAAVASAPKKITIEQVDLIHFSHTDIGFTDHPVVCRELQRRYLDIAIDAALATCAKPSPARFYWTAEGTVAVEEWWRAASPERREAFLKVVDSGQLDISAVAMNNTPFLNAAEWKKMVHWLPEDLWQRVQPKVALQDDVNGFPRAGALALLDRGIHQLFMGINTDNGGTPFPTPKAFWWKMPDGRRMFVYLGYPYPTGYGFFEPTEWRHGPVPQASDSTLR